MSRNYESDSSGHRTGSDWYDGFSHESWLFVQHLSQKLTGDKLVRTSSVEYSEYRTVGSSTSANHPDAVPIDQLHWPASISITDADGRTSVTVIPLPGTNSPGVHNTGDRSWLGDVLDGFWKGAQAEGYALLDAFTPDWLLDVSADKADAWKDARLNGTTTQMIGEFSAGAARELAILVGTAGLGNVASASRAAALIMVPVRTALVGREIYAAVENGSAAIRDFSKGDILAGLGHSALFGLNIIGGKLSIRQLTSDVKYAFPKSVVRTNAQLVDAIGSRAGQWAQRSRQQATLAGASPQTVGIKQHGYADRLLRRYQRIYGDRGLSTEVRYLNGLVWKSGMPLKGSVRLDVVEGPLNVPTAVFDYKFGEAGLTLARITQLRAGARLAHNIPIIEVRP